MRTVSTLYHSMGDLKYFIKKNKIFECQNILLQIFTGICESEFIEKLIDNIIEEIPHIHIIGATTDGEIIANHIVERSTILSFSLFDNTQIATHYCKNINSIHERLELFTNQFDATKKAKVAIAFGDGLHTNGEEFIKGMKNYNENIIVAGGLAGDNAAYVKTIVFNEEEILTNGAVVALLYNDDLIVNTKANFGWDNIGKTLTITKAKKNIVYTIDGIKAVDIYEKYLGKNIAEELPKTGMEFPLIIKRDGLNIARAVVGKNDDGSLIFAGNLTTGDKVTFGYGNIETIINGGTKVYKEILSSPVESIFVYSCMARKALMGKNTLAEIKPLNKIAPVSGFFTYGEFFSKPNSSQKEFLNETMTILCLSERNIKTPRQGHFNFKDRRKRSSSTLQALSHLVARTTLELEEINSSLESKVKQEVEKNREKDNQMIQQSRMAQMGEMMSMIAHQWRQPLSAISATAIAIQLSIDLNKLDTDELAKRVANISSYAQHLSATIDDFRDFFKPNKNKTNTNYQDVVKNVLEIIKVSIDNKNINLILEIECKETFLTYANELKQVVLNLIKNAEDAILDKKIENPYIKIKTFQDEDNYNLKICDNAGGIPKDIIGRIFDPYFTTKLGKGGTGLGLYMSKTIIEEHCNGKLTVTNGDDGAIFTIAIRKEQKDD